MIHKPSKISLDMEKRRTGWSIYEVYTSYIWSKWIPIAFRGVRNDNSKAACTQYHSSNVIH